MGEGVVEGLNGGQVLFAHFPAAQQSQALAQSCSVPSFAVVSLNNCGWRPFGSKAFLATPAKLLGSLTWCEDTQFPCPLFFCLPLCPSNLQPRSSRPRRGAGGKWWGKALLRPLKEGLGACFHSTYTEGRPGQDGVRQRRPPTTAQNLKGAPKQLPTLAGSASLTEELAPTLRANSVYLPVQNGPEQKIQNKTSTCWLGI